MSRLSIALGLCIAWCSAAHAQLAPYNPYAPQQEDPNPIRADGKLNWPAFFKDQRLHQKFQTYAAMGSCVGTAKGIVNMLSENRVDVNQLPDATLQGKAVRVVGGVVNVLDREGKALLFVTHPAGVSKVSVSGRMPAGDLKPGMLVRLVGAVDEHGSGREPLTALDVVSPGPKAPRTAVEAGRTQTIVGQVVRHSAHLLQLRVDAGKLRRLTFQLSEDPAIEVIGASTNLIAVGDDVTAEGHVYRGAGPAGMTVVFAAKVDASKPSQAQAAPTSSSASSNLDFSGDSTK